MKGELIIIKRDRIKAGKQLIWLLDPEIANTPDKYVKSVAGESGNHKGPLLDKNTYTPYHPGNPLTFQNSGWKYLE